MPYKFLKNLSRHDLELQRINQLNVLKFSVVYEELLIRQQGRMYLEKVRNEALDKLLIINKILSDYHDSGTK